MSATVHDLNPSVLRVSGVSRADNEKALLVSFNRRLTDDEMRFLHEVIERGTSFVEWGR